MNDEPSGGFPAEFLYRRQFVIGPRVLPEYAHWRQLRFADSLHLSCHPHLNVAEAQAPACRILMLGHLLDPAKPDATDEENTRGLVAQADSFDAFERASSRLGGRWVMLVQIGNEQRLYPDAGRDRPVFYVSGRPDVGVWLATQPGLFVRPLGLKADASRCRDFLRAHAHDAWPGEVTPYPDVRQLLPNHFLDIRGAEARRFWPKGDLPERDLDSAARMIVKNFHGQIAGALHRRRVALPLSGGNDSRVLLAAAGEMRKSISLFTVLHPDIRQADVRIPKKIARRLGLAHRTIRVRAATDEMRQILRQNTGDMFWDPGLKWVQAFGEFDRDYFVLTGNDAGILRAIYYSDGTIDKPLTPERLAHLSAYYGNPVAISEMGRWMQSLPRVSDSLLLDLFHWEFRVGNWSALAKTLLDTVCDVIVPYNCREVLEAGLSVNPAHRVRPVALFRRMHEMAAPELADIPVNETWQDDALDRASRLVPWRVRDSLSKWRQRRAGFVLEDSLPPALNGTEFPPGRGYEF